MQLKTLGTVFAACTGLGSTAVLALAPDYKIIAWVILIGSILWLLGALVLFVRAHFRLRLPWERRPEGGAANETPTVASASVATQQRRRYTAYDLQKRQQALDEFSNFIVGPTTTLLERGLKLMRDCNNSVFSMGEFYHQLDEYRGLIHNTEQDVSQLMMKHHIYSDLIQAVGWTDCGLMGTTDGLRFEVIRLRKFHTQDDRAGILFNNIPMQRWRDNLNDLANAIAEMKKSVQAKRSEYGNAEIAG